MKKSRHLISLKSLRNVTASSYDSRMDRFLLTICFPLSQSILIYSVGKESVSFTTSLRGTTACSVYATRENIRDLLVCNESNELRLFMGGLSAFPVHVDLPEDTSIESD